MLFRSDLALANRPVEAAREAGVAIFPVLLRSSTISDASLSMNVTATNRESNQRRELQQAEGRSLFLGMAAATGGKIFAGSSGASIVPQLLKQIAGQLQDEYVAGFYTTATSRQKRRHNIRVLLRSNGSIEGGTRVLVY